MSHNRNQTAIAGEQARRQERKSRVLHAPKREARRQNQEIVAAPLIGTELFFGNIEHVLRIRKFINRCIKQFWLGVNTGILTQWREVQIADSNGQQVGRDGLRHIKLVLTTTRRHRIVVGAHDRQQFRRRADNCLIGDAHGRCILQRHPTTRVDRL